MYPCIWEFSALKTGATSKTPFEIGVDNHLFMQLGALGQAGTVVEVTSFEDIRAAFAYCSGKLRRIEPSKGMLIEVFPKQRANPVGDLEKCLIAQSSKVDNSVFQSSGQRDGCAAFLNLHQTPACVVELNRRHALLFGGDEYLGDVNLRIYQTG